MSKRKIIAVVDDDESVRESLPELLRSIGFDSDAFASAEDFLASRSLERADCLILDVVMPGMTGPELQGELARRRNDVPIVFITAHAAERTGPEVLRRGAVAYVTKPFSEETIVNALHAAFARDSCAPNG